MQQLVKEFIKSCDPCARAKVPRHQPYRLFHPWLVPRGPWLSLSMDSITNFLNLKENNSTLVVVNQLTKMAHFISYNKTIIEKWLSNFSRAYLKHP